MEGSCATDIWVLDVDVVRAAELLRQDPDGDPYSVTLYYTEPGTAPNDGRAGSFANSDSAARRYR